MDAVQEFYNAFSQQLILVRQQPTVDVFDSLEVHYERDPSHLVGLDRCRSDVAVRAWGRKHMQLCPNMVSALKDFLLAAFYEVHEI